MTVNTTNITSGPYAGNDVTTEFSYTFRIESKTQMVVYLTNIDGSIDVLTVDTDYTVSGIGEDSGGIITKSTALATGQELFIRADYKQTQATDFDSQGGFFPDVHEASFDKLTFLIQQLNDIQDRRSILFDDSLNRTTSQNKYPTPVTGQALVWQTDGSLGNADLSISTSDGIISVSSYTTLKAVGTSSFSTGQVLSVAYRTNQGDKGGGEFVWVDSDLSSQVTADTQEAIYIPPSTDVTGASGAFVRRYDDYIRAKWFGAIGDNSTDDTTAIDAFFTFLSANGGSGYLGDENDIYLVDALSYNSPSAAFNVWGKATLKKRTNAAANMLQFELTARNNTPIFLMGFTVDGDYSTHAEGGQGIVASDVSHFICDDITVKDVKSSGIITFNETASVTGITQANPAVVTYSGDDDWQNGDMINIGDVTGMTEINDSYYLVSNVDTGSNTFEITDVDGNAIDSTAYTAYVSDGTIARITEGIILRNCVIKGEGNTKNGLLIVDATNSGIENGRVLNVTEFALELKNACDQAWIKGGLVNGCDLYGIELGQTSGSGPRNCQISDVQLKACDGGIEMSNGQWNNFSNIKMDFAGAPGTVNGVINCSGGSSNNSFINMHAINIPANIYAVRFRTNNMNNLCHFSLIEKTNSSDTIRFDATAAGNTVTFDRYSIAGVLQESIYDTVSDASTSQDNVVHYTRVETVTQYEKTFTDADTTPSVKAGSVFETANTGATTITDFDDGSNCQQITVVFTDSNTTIDFTSTSLKGNGGTNWTPSPDDSMICTLIGTNWYCQISDNSA